MIFNDFNLLDSFCTGLILGTSLDISRLLLVNQKLFKPAACVAIQPFTTTVAPLIASAYFITTFSSSSLQLVRRKEDNINQLVGFGSTALFFFKVSAKPNRLRVLNGFVGGMLISGLLFANCKFDEP